MMVASLADPPPASVLLPATAWVQDTLLGTLATAIGVVAIAAVGLMMLSGRIEARRGLTVLAGCFVLFGAGTIANELRSFERGEDMQAKVAAAPSPLTLPETTGSTQQSPFDPYAGASVQR